jgi:hypothetical protein
VKTTIPNDVRFGTKDIETNRALLQASPSGALEAGALTADLLEKLTQWFRGVQWDIIHFSWGLHDVKYWKNGKLDLTGEQLNSIENNQGKINLGKYNSCA